MTHNYRWKLRCFLSKTDSKALVPRTKGRAKSAMLMRRVTWKDSAHNILSTFLLNPFEKSNVAVKTLAFLFPGCEDETQNLFHEIVRE